MGTPNVKHHLVISAVNIAEAGTLEMLRGCLQATRGLTDRGIRVTALVHRRDLVDAPHVNVLEFPQVKGSWRRRYKFERTTSYELALDLRPNYWLALHDMTPRLPASVRQAVYCHNALSFTPMGWRDLILDPVQALQWWLYPFLYKSLISRNEYVIVQHDWMRQAMIRRWGLHRVIVARPEPTNIATHAKRTSGPRFLYASLPRVFKNFELLLTAWALLEQQPDWDGNLSLTLAGTENPYARWIHRRFGHLKRVRFLGRLTREQMSDEYDQSDCLVYPSRIESWGVPLTEARERGLSILAVDLPYAHETLAGYGHVAFFGANDPAALAQQMRHFRTGHLALTQCPHVKPAEPVATTWEQLLAILMVEGPTNQGEAVS